MTNLSEFATIYSISKTCVIRAIERDKMLYFRCSLSKLSEVISLD